MKLWPFNRKPKAELCKNCKHEAHDGKLCRNIVFPGEHYCRCGQATPVFESLASSRQRGFTNDPSAPYPFTDETVYVPLVIPIDTSAAPSWQSFGGGDSGGAGASSSWNDSAPTPDPAPSSNCDSSSDSSSSYDSSSSSDSSSSDSGGSDS